MPIEPKDLDSRFQDIGLDIEACRGGMSLLREPQRAGQDSQKS